MKKIKLSIDEYLDKVRGCWTGKNIGGTLGAPFEGEKFTHGLRYYDLKAIKRWLKNVKYWWEREGVKLEIDVDKFDFNQPLPNDDLDFQLVYLKMLEERGINLKLNDFVDFWKKYLYRHWYSEYSWCLYNLKRGLKPPISGVFQNYYIDEMGSPIRSEIWACVAPANPQISATLAWMDSCLDHAGGEGMYGEIFWASIESAAFVIEDPLTLINIGLSMIPLSSQIARCVKEAVRCYKEGVEWGQARERIATLFGHHNACNAVPNHGFIILGWLYGEDFGDKLCKAVNCGFDTDCTGATLGSILGIIHGFSGIPEEWKKPIGDLITPVPLTVKEGLPLTISELTERTYRVAQKMLKEKSEFVEFSDKTEIPEDILSILSDNEKIRDLLKFDIHSSVDYIENLQVVLHYGGEPVIYPRIVKTLEISIMENWKEQEISNKEIEVNLPNGWKLIDKKMDRFRFKFKVYCEKPEKYNKIEVKIKINNKVEKLIYTILSSEIVKIFAASTSAPRED